MIYCFHALHRPLLECLRLVFLLMKELNLNDGSKMLLKKTALFGSFLLGQIRGAAQRLFKLLSENKEKRHQGQNQAGELKIKGEHGSHDEDGVECGL